MRRILAKLLLVVILTSSGQLLLKLGARCFIFPENLFLLPIRIAQNKFLFAGGATYAINFLLYTHVLSEVKLSIAYPFIGLTYIVVVLGSVFLLGESITAKTIAGIIFIAIGVALIGIGLEG